ncbi:aminoglycoside 6'-N-acetyltransferase [Paenibacillus favisporus]|uniref:Aminoglycoside 6'-N-acetyltransferase n=1 Tax=Paenibacillus favisporus TaxID=221028 RepID=A0ABV2FCM9_9BACL
MILWSKQGVSVRKLEAGDADHLVRWLSDPRVLEYYEGRDRPHDMAMVQEHFYRDDQIEACIIQLDDRDIGYIQYYHVDPEEREVYGYGEGDGRIFGMDQFIGEPDCWNRGIGTRLIQGMVSYLTNTLQADKIVMDPQTWNARALRVYEKCGFRKIKLLEKREWHEGEYRDCWLIEYNAANGGEKRDESL